MQIAGIDVCMATQKLYRKYSESSKLKVHAKSKSKSLRSVHQFAETTLLIATSVKKYV